MKRLLRGLPSSPVRNDGGLHGGAGGKERVPWIWMVLRVELSEVPSCMW